MACYLQLCKQRFENIEFLLTIWENLPAKWSARIIYKLPVLGIYDKGDATKPLIFLEEIRSADVDQRRRAFYWFG